MIPNEVEPRQETTKTGDLCHYNLVGWTNGSARAAFKSADIQAFEICDAGAPRPLTLEDMG